MHHEEHEAHEAKAGKNFVFFVFFVVNSLNQEITYLINVRSQQLQLLKPGQFFYGTLPLAGGTAVMAGLYINQLFGLPAAEILGTLFVCMLTETPGNIVSNAGIKRIIGAQDDVDLPIHDYTTVPKIDPTAAVKPIASAPQKTTRNAPLTIPAPPL